MGATWRSTRYYKPNTMRTTVFFLLLAMIVSGACKKKADTCPTDVYEYTYKDNAQVDTVRAPVNYAPLAATVNTGTKRVFTYRWSHIDCPQIADGGGGALLYFEVDPALSHFKYYADSLAAIKCYYMSLCGYCVPRDASVPVGGTIEGTKINDKTWKVDIDLKTGTYSTLKTSASFVKAN